MLNDAGIFGAWAVNEPSTDGILGIREPVEQSLDLAGDLLDRISAGLERARGVISTIDAAAELLGDNIEESRPLLTLISKALGDELGPVVEYVGEIVSTARAAATTIQNALETVDGLPFVSLGEGGLETTRAEKMATRVADVATSLEEPDTGVQERRSEAAEEIVGRITSTTSEISAFLDDLQSEVDGYRAQISDLQTRVATVKARVPLWIDLGVDSDDVAGRLARSVPGQYVHPRVGILHRPGSVGAVAMILPWRRFQASASLGGAKRKRDGRYGRSWP